MYASGMAPASALYLRVEASLRFMRPHLAGRRRVLDVGCGEGRLVEQLAAAGYDAAGIDTSDEAVEAARAAGRNVTREDFFDVGPGPFDAIYFGGSLHHLHPLNDAVSHAATLLAEDGVLLADEFDLDAPDERTAGWFVDLLDLIEVFGLAGEHVGHGGDTAFDPAADPLEQWRERHRHDPPLAGGSEMLEALGRHFDVVGRESCEYLYWYALRPLDSRPDGREIGERLIELERRLIAAGRIRPVGLRIVARRRGRT